MKTKDASKKQRSRFETVKLRTYGDDCPILVKMGLRAIDVVERGSGSVEDQATALLKGAVMRWAWEGRDPEELTAMFGDEVRKSWCCEEAA